MPVEKKILCHEEPWADLTVICSADVDGAPYAKFYFPTHKKLQIPIG